MLERKIKFNGQTLKLRYRDDSDQSVIDEFFVDRTYRCVEKIIPTLTHPIVDIGAHIGIFSLYSSCLAGRQAIFAIEPEPDNFELLKYNLELNNCKNVKPINAALVSGVELSANLYLSKNTHNHSTMPLSTNSIQVPAINLERLMKENEIKKIGLLKMDIEGAEFEIIVNLKSSIFKKIQNLVVEYHESSNHKRSDIETIIREHGFSVEHFPNKFDRKFGLLVCRNKK